MGERSNSNHQGTREATPAQVERVLLVLARHRGKQHAIKRGLLCELAGLGDQGRTLTAACREITLDPTTPEVVGLDMAAGAVYLCATTAEVDETYRYYHSIGLEYLERAQAISRKAARAVAAQPSLMDFAEISA